MRSFGSDNHSGIHPDVLQAIIDANNDHALSYGDDEWTAKAIDALKNIFGKDSYPYIVFNGTGANVIALRACTRTFNSIISAETAHIAVDECGAPEFMTGASLKEIKTPDGKLTPELIKPQLYDWGFEHHSQPKVVYISQCSELGTVYSIDEIKTLADFLHGYGMYLHVDGARLSNAAVSLGISFKEMTVDCGVDILSFGGTKNGMMLGEAVIAFRPELAENIKYLRKQTTQLYSKMRFTSCQFLAYLNNELWKKNASNANKMAQLLRTEILSVADVEFTQKTDANILLMKLPETTIKKLLQQHFFYMWSEANNEIRLVTSWNTTENDVEKFVTDLKQAI